MAEIEVRHIGADGWQLMRDVWLAALLGAPEAFSSSYQREAGFGPADWLDRITRGANFLAYATGAGSTSRILYERCGFTPTGERQPLASRPGLTEIAMTRSV